MEENKNKNALKKLLDRLQEDSWQLELLVSGFTIFGLFSAFGPVKDAFLKALYEDDILKDVYQTVLLAIVILIFNLIIHLVLRSLWIGALGVRYISGEVEIEKLNYSKHFTNYLIKKNGSFDNYIEKLEKLCSIIFAISFLLIFYVAGIFIVLHLINDISLLATDNASIYTRIFLVSLQTLLIAGAVLTFFDYVTQGLLKKNKWIAKLYFPFYWAFSYLTLSFLYRPLYYNLIGSKFGRRVSFVILPFYITVLFITNVYKEQSRFISFSSVTSSTIRANSRNYEDLVEKNNLFISVLTIQSKVITDPYIKVKIPLSKSIEDNILEFNTDLKPYQAEYLYKSAMFRDTQSSISKKASTDSLHLEYIKTFQHIYSLKIDSMKYKPGFVIVKEGSYRNSIIGFETYIGTNKLAEGKHTLVYSRYKHPDTDSIITIKEIPFWYYKN
ncbi:MAG: hypothetical protein QM478_12155 [Flavobacteriaceae bacterium]